MPLPMRASLRASEISTGKPPYVMVREPGRGRGQSLDRCVVVRGCHVLCAVASLVSNVVSCVVCDRSERPDQEQRGALVQTCAWRQNDQVGYKRVP